MKGDKERVLECTTSIFDGLIAMVNPQDSWVVSEHVKEYELVITDTVNSTALRLAINV